MANNYQALDKDIRDAEPINMLNAELIAKRHNTKPRMVISRAVVIGVSYTPAPKPTTPSVYGRRQEGPTKKELIRQLEVGMKAEDGEFVGLDMASRQSIEALMKRMEEQFNKLQVSRKRSQQYQKKC